MFDVPLLLLQHYAVSGLLKDTVTIICLQSSRNLADPVSGLAPSADMVGDGSPARSVANPPLSGVVASGSSAGNMSPVPSTSSTTSEAAANVRASVELLLAHSQIWPCKCLHDIYDIAVTICHL